MSHAPLSIYLNDHLALLTAEVELGRRVERENQGTPLAEFMSRYVQSCRRGRAIVKGLIHDSGSKPSALKESAGWLVEKAGRLKPNDSLTEYTDLARVVELETLLSLVQGRLSLWLTLEKVGSQPADSSGAGWQAECEEANDQVKTLHGFHQLAAAQAFRQSSEQE